MIFLLALSLSIDAFAVGVSCGMSVPKFRERRALLLAVYFGLFHFGMTAVGAFTGRTLGLFLNEAGGILAFLLLVAIGGNMVWEAVRKKKDETDIKCLSHPKMLSLSVATSIDVLAVGVSLGITGGSLLLYCAVIGAAAFCMTLLGGLLGDQVGERFSGQASIVGGLVLIVLGVRSLF